MVLLSHFPSHTDLLMHDELLSGARIDGRRILYLFIDLLRNCNNNVPEYIEQPEVTDHLYVQTAPSIILQHTVTNYRSVHCYMIILPDVLYGCKTWSLIMREECRLGVLQNRALKRLFGPKRDEVTGKWRKTT